MKKILLKVAEIPFVVKTSDDEIAEWAARHFSGELVDYDSQYFSGIEIEIEEASGLIAENYYEYLAQPPEVTLKGSHLFFKHPFFRGTLSLTEGKSKVWFTGREFLISYLRTVLTVIIVNYGGAALHSSCIKRNGKVYIFTGYSGAGKSTIIKLTDDPIIYSDETTLLKKDEKGNFSVHHSPFRSEFYTQYQPPAKDIAGIFFIRQDSQVFLEDLPLKEALFKMLPMIFFPINKPQLFETKIFELCADLLNQVPVFNLHFRKDGTFWECIERACKEEINSI